MARKNSYSSTDTLNQLIAKLNTKSDYLGDLDEISARIKDSNFDTHGHRTPFIQDSQNTKNLTIVNALNYIDSASNQIDSGLQMFDDSPRSVFPSLGTVSMSIDILTGDSAVFNNIRVGQLTADSNVLVLDSAHITTLTGLSLNYDSANFDSARIDFISGLTINYDSGFGTGIGINPAFPGVGSFDILRLEKIDTIDSGRITSISGDSCRYDSSNFGIVSMDSMRGGLTNQFTGTFLVPSGTEISLQKMSIDLQTFTDVKQLGVKDKAGTVVLAGFIMSTSNDSDTP